MNLIQMTHGSDTPLVLHGAGAAAPFRGAAFTPLGDPLGESKERGRSPYIDEVIELVLENNSPAAIAAGFSGIEYFLQLAKEQAATGIGKPAYLDCIGAPGDASYRSQIFDGWLETAGGERAGGSVGLRLHLARASFWEASDELPLKLALPGQASTFSELTLYNHRDSDMGHTNLFQVLGADAAGDLPAAARLEIRNINTGTMRNFFLSADHHPNVGGTYRFFDTSTLDSQFESGGTYSADGTCTYGSKNTHSWAGAGETVLGSWALTALTVAPCQGRTYKPVLRLPGGSGYADLWLRFRIKDGGGYVIWDGPYALLPTSVELVDLAPIPLPPNLAEVSPYYSTVTIDLLAKRLAGGSPALSLDFISALPTDHFIKGLGRNTGCVSGKTLFIDGFISSVYTGTTRTSGISSDFQLYGDPGIRVYPGQDEEFCLLWMSSPTAAAIDRTVGVTAYYRPRKRLL